MKNSRRLREAIRTHEVDILHACSRAPAWSSLLAVKHTKAKFVTSCHSAHKVNGWAKRLYNSSIGRGEKVIAVSQFLSDYLATNYAVDRDKIRVIHRGVSTKKFFPALVSREERDSFRRNLGIKEATPLLLLPGRLTKSKGHLYLLDAIAELGRKDVKCLFVGTLNPGYLEKVEAHIAALDLKDQIVVIPASNDMPKVYAASDIVVAPSIHPEGFGRVAIEAQAMGKPVISTRHGGAIETISEGKTGWLVESGSIAELADCLRKALSLTETEKRAFSAAALENVQMHFTNEIMTKNTLSVYEELIG